MDVIAATEVHVDQMVGEEPGGAFETGELQMEVNELAVTVRVGVGATAKERGEHARG